MCPSTSLSFAWHPFILLLFYLWAENAACARVCVCICMWVRVWLSVLRNEVTNGRALCSVWHFFDYLWCNLLQFQKRLSLFSGPTSAPFLSAFSSYLFLSLSGPHPLSTLYHCSVLFLMPLDAHSTISSPSPPFSAHLLIWAKPKWNVQRTVLDFNFFNATANLSALNISILFASE